MRTICCTFLAAALALGLSGPGARASSHREAPLISEDAPADSSDFYFFRSPATDGAGAGTVTLIANYYPFQEPGGGPNWARFSEGVLYEIKIDNDGDAREDITFQFRFRTQYKAARQSFALATNPITGPADVNLNTFQTYTVTRIDKSGRKVIGKDLLVPPPYAGTYTMGANYENAIARPTIALLEEGNGRVFCGQRDDPFFADLGAIFDLLRLRCQMTPNLAAGCGGTAMPRRGVDFLGGYNVLSIALQVPIARLTADGLPNPMGKNAVLGAWTTASRARMTIRRTPSPAAAQGGVRTQDDFGGFVQVSRLGLPLINEVLLPVGLKDYYNTLPPSGDAALFGSQAGMTVLGNPELAQSLKALYNVSIPPQGRSDLAELTQFHVRTNAEGMPLGPFRGLEHKLAAADILRLDVSVPAPANLAVNPQGALGRFVDNVNDPSIGFPNGRRPQDDVVDILLSVMSGVLRGAGMRLGDGVNANDRGFAGTFPYLAAPWSGSEVGANMGSNSLLHQFR